MLESSFQVGRVAGIRIGIHYTWLIIFFLMNTSLYFVFRQELVVWSYSSAILTALVTSTIFFISIILHELGHSIVAIRNGISVRSITLFIFGGVAQSEKEADSAIVEFKIAIAGPAVSLLLAGIFFALRDLLGHIGAPLYVSLDWLATINLIVAIFNLIPGFPLDGGRVFRSIIWGITGDEAKGMRLAVAGGRLVAYGLMGMGMYSAIQTGNILNGIWLIGIGWFLLSAAESSARAFSQSRIFKRLSIRELMNRNVPRIQKDKTIRQWVSEKVLPELNRAALVEDQGAVVGLVSLSDTHKIPENDWDSHKVAEIMTPIASLRWVALNGNSEDVLRAMQERSINQVPIVDGEEVVGWVDRETQIHAISVYSEAGSA